MGRHNLNIYSKTLGRNLLVLSPRRFQKMLLNTVLCNNSFSNLLIDPIKIKESIFFFYYFWH